MPPLSERATPLLPEPEQPASEGTPPGPPSSSSGLSGCKINSSPRGAGVVGVCAGSGSSAPRPRHSARSEMSGKQEPRGSPRLSSEFPRSLGVSPDAWRSSPAALCPQESMRKVFPLNLGGSDTCYFCKKRVYVMERLSAEGHFFHRECFRCSVCASTLRLAAYAFDGDEGNSWRLGVAPGALALCPLKPMGCPCSSQGLWCPRERCSWSWEVLL